MSLPEICRHLYDLEQEPEEVDLAEAGMHVIDTTEEEEIPA